MKERLIGCDRLGIIMGRREPKTPEQYRDMDEILNEFSGEIIAVCTCGYEINFIEIFIEENYGVKLWEKFCKCATDDTIPA